MSSTTENNAISEQEATAESFPSVCMKPFSILGSQKRVENPFDDTQVFVEVQFREKSHVYLTRKGILIDAILSRKKYESVARGRLTAVKILPINLADLFASDIFCNCNSETLFSRDILDSSSKNHRFWNFFKRVVSRYGNKVAHLCLEIKRSVITIVVRVELVSIRHNEYNDEDEASMEDEFVSCLRHKLNRLSERRLKGNDVIEENQEEDRLSMLETVDIKRFNENDDDEENQCAICLEEFKKENKVMRLDCGHLFHNKCIIHWIEENNDCPSCMDELTAEDCEVV